MALVAGTTEVAPATAATAGLDPVGPFACRDWIDLFGFNMIDMPTHFDNGSIATPLGGADPAQVLDLVRQETGALEEAHKAALLPIDRI